MPRLPPGSTPPAAEGGNIPARRSVHSPSAEGGKKALSLGGRKTFSIPLCISVERDVFLYIFALFLYFFVCFGYTV